MVAACAVAVLGLTAPASAQQVRLHVLADSVTVGERFEIAVAVEHGPGEQVVFPSPPADPLASTLRAGEAELLGVRRLPPAVRDAARIDSAVFEAAAFALDSARVGPVTVRLVRGADTLVVASPSVWLGVRSLVPEDATPHPIAPLLPFPRALAPWLLALLGALALAVAVWLWRRRSGSRPVPTSTLPPHEEVAVRLDALAADLPDTPEAVKPFYVELSDALRTYLARTLDVPAHEQTTRELLTTLLRSDVPEDALGPLADVLHLADLAKFAGAQPDAEAHETALARARDAVAVLETALAPEPEETAPLSAEVPASPST